LRGCFEHPLDRFRELLALEGLFEQGQIGSTFRLEGCGREAGGQQNLEGWPQSLGLAGQVEAAHPVRQHHIGEEEIDPLGALQHLAPRQPILGLDHRIAEPT
jgi:hypothetical protein